MSNYTNLDSLATSVLAELERLGYSSEAVAGYRRMYANLARYADENGFTAFSESLAVEFISWKFGTGVEDLYRAKPTTGHMKNYLRSMRIMLEWDSCGCVYKRKPGALGLTSLPEGLQLQADDAVVRVPEGADGYAEGVTVTHVRFARTQSVTNDEHRSADAGAGKVYVDAVAHHLRPSVRQCRKPLVLTNRHWPKCEK